MINDSLINALGQFIGLLNGQDKLNTAWFSDPFGGSDDLKTLLSDTTQTAALFNLFNDILIPTTNQPVVPGASTTWYEIPNPTNGSTTPACLILPSAGQSSGEIGFGTVHNTELAGLSITIYAYVALMDIDPPSNPTVLITTNAPKVGIQINNSTPLGAPAITTVSLDAVLDPSAPLMKLDFYASETLTKSFSSLSTLLADTTYVSILIDEVLQSTMMQYWLNKFVGVSKTTFGDLLAKAGLLEQSGPNLTVYTLDVAFLTTLASESPMQIVEQLVNAALTGLSAVDPLIPIEGGGISIVEDGAGSNQFGINLQIPDLMLKQPSATSQKKLLLQLGSWLTGGTDQSNWVKESGITDPAAGINIFFINSTPTSFSIMTPPTLELVSIGVDYLGTDSKHPLFDIKGIRLQGVETRIYLNTKTDKFGGAMRLDEIGIPLGPPAGTNSSSNPVAGNVLSSGSGTQGDTGSASVAVNPSFSIVTSYLNNTFNFQMYDAQGNPTDTIWLPLQRTFGPLKCQKIGIGWQETTKDLLMIFDGSIELGGLEVDLIDLSIGIPVTDPTDASSYELGLKGLNVLYEKGDVHISGGFMQSGSGSSVEYNGEVIIDVSKFGMGAIGSYGTTSTGDVSLFIFASMTTPLGGPPAFFVDGLSLGFGYNRKLVAPAMDKVTSFPLVAASANPAAIGLTPGANIQPDQLAGILSTFDAAVPVALGEFWMAAGVKFISFDLINSNVLLALTFGKEFEILILGTSLVQLPPPPENADVFVSAELEIEITIEPSKGFAGATAVLAPSSFVLTPDCHLTGGFAFYAWFGDNTHAGDFVLTLGGYNLAFQKPSWYPTVPRLGFSWNISSDLSIEGGVYFALTPSCVMGGGALNASFHMGSFLQAWFTAHADFLITYKPFSYIIGVGVSIGVRANIPLLFVTLHVSLSVGADISIWGPSTGGYAHVHLYFVSFGISFGPSQTSISNTVNWDGVAKMLPKSSNAAPPNALQSGHVPMGEAMLAKNVTQAAAPTIQNPAPLITINDGLLSTDKTTGIWTVRGADFMFSTTSAVPCTTIEIGSSGQFTNADPFSLTPESGSAAQFNVRPMGLDQTTSVYSISLAADGDNADAEDMDYHHWVFESEYSDMPDAIWGTPIPAGSTPAPAANMTNCMVGLTNITPKAHIPNGPPAIDITTAFTDVPVMMDIDDYPNLPISEDVLPSGDVPSYSPLVFSELSDVYNAVQPTKIQTNRDNLISAFGALGLYEGSPGDLSKMASDPQEVFQNAPMINYETI